MEFYFISPYTPWRCVEVPHLYLVLNSQYPSTYSLIHLTLLFYAHYAPPWLVTSFLTSRWAVPSHLCSVWLYVATSSQVRSKYTPLSVHLTTSVFRRVLSVLLTAVTFQKQREQRLNTAAFSDSNMSFVWCARAHSGWANTEWNYLKILNIR